MRKTAVLLVIVIAIFVIPQPADLQLFGKDSAQSPIAAVNNGLFMAASGGVGASSQSTQFMSRTLTSQRFSIVNTYGATSKHNGTIDFIQFSLPGWSLYRVTMNVQNLTASLEREVLGITPKTGTQEFLIDEVLTDVFSDQLTQAFYNQPHDGSLKNYSIRYYDFGYDESTYGYAFFEVRSSYSDNATGMTTRTNLTHRGSYTWVAFAGNDADLTKNTMYWAMIDGSNLKKVGGNYPHIYWSYEDSAGTYNTGQHVSSWLMNRPYEALLNYSYVPWNRTTTSSLVYRQPQTIRLRANSTPLTDSSVWSFSSPSSISRIQFDSNQSVYVYYNLTMWYQKTSSTAVSWSISSPGSIVNWNSTATVSYPSTSGQVSRFLNISKMSDWVPVGLYNGTSSSDYDHFTSDSNVVYCTLMTNGTWRLKTTSFNYLTLIATKDADSGGLLPKTTSILARVNITSSVEDSASRPASSGTTNLTVWQSGSRLSWTPSNLSVVGGKTDYIWDISSTTSKNGSYVIEVFWTNGTEAGYLAKEMIVYYPTSLNTDDYFLEAFTDSTFFFKIQYNDSFNLEGLNLPDATVVYSFDDKANVSMNDGHSNGTWTATVSTAGMSRGDYSLKVFAEGYAIENRSITITVSLALDTQPLSTAWSDGNNITYAGESTLSVYYRFVNGTAINGATVNATIGTTPWALLWDPGDQNYQMVFNASDLSLDLDNYSVTIRAWKDGCISRDAILSLIVREEPSFISVLWLPSNITITYVQSFNLTVQYTYGGGNVPPWAAVNVTIDGHPYTLNYSAGAWHVSIPGKDIGLDTHDAIVRAGLHGYEYKTAMTWDLNVTRASDSLISITASEQFGPYSSSDLYNDGWVIVSIRVLDEGSNPIMLANVTLTINSTTYSFTPIGNNYTLTMQALNLGIGNHSGIITVYTNGYQNKTSSLALEVKQVPAHIPVTPGQIPSIMYLNETCEFVLEYVEDHNSSAIAGALAFSDWPNSVIDEISPGVYRVTISSFLLSLNSHLFNITFSHGNYTTAFYQVSITVRPVFTHLTFGQDPPLLYENETVSIWANYTDSDHGQYIRWASVNATINSIVYSMTHIGQGIYSVSLLITLPPAAYSVSIVAAAAGCSSNTTTFVLNVEEKKDVYLSLDFLGSPVEGNSITIKALLRYNGSDSPVVNALVEFEVAAVYGNGSRQTFVEAYLTSNAGEASWSFNIPVSSLSAVDHLEVIATYHGATSMWPASKTLEIKVTLGMIALLFIFLTSTEGLVVMACIFGAVVAAAYQEKKRKPKKLAFRRSLQHQLQDFKDLGTLRHFMAVYLNRGTCVFYHPFTESRIQADLISGFISAITSVYGEIKGNGVQGTLEEIHYHGLRLNSYSGKYVIGMLILEGELTPLLKDRLQYFVERFEDQYQDDLKNWSGQTECFDPDWIVSNIIAAFNFNWVLPHKLSPQKKMTGVAKKILHILGRRLDEKGEFLIGEVLAPVAKAIGRTEPEVLDYLLRMEEKGLITPISISTVLQRQEMALVDKEVYAAGEAPLSPGEVEVVTPKTEEEQPRSPEIRPETMPRYARGMEARAPIETTTPGEIQPEAAPEAPPEHVELKPEEQFLAEVEKLLIAERERKQRVAQMKEKKRKDEAESFIDDVERLLASDKEKD